MVEDSERPCYALSSLYGLLLRIQNTTTTNATGLSLIGSQSYGLYAIGGSGAPASGFGVFDITVFCDMGGE